jgi:hypothetical protein
MEEKNTNNIDYYIEALLSGSGAEIHACYIGRTRLGHIALPCLYDGERKKRRTHEYDVLFGIYSILEPAARFGSKDRLGRTSWTLGPSGSVRLNGGRQSNAEARGQCGLA